MSCLLTNCCTIMKRIEKSEIKLVLHIYAVKSSKRVKRINVDVNSFVERREKEATRINNF